MKARVSLCDVIRQSCMTRATIDNLVFGGEQAHFLPFP